MKESAPSSDFEITEPKIAIEEYDVSAQISTKESQSTLREHLESRFNPIIACIGTHSMYANGLPEKLQIMFDPNLARQNLVEGNLGEMLFKLGVDNIDYSATSEEKERYQMISPGQSEYVLSPINSLDKYSGGFYHCFGMVVVGQDKDTGVNISFGLHTPLYDMSEGNERDAVSLSQMKNDIRANLNEMKERCVPGSIDAVILGGFEDRTEPIGEINNKLLGFLGNEVDEVLNFHPVFIAGEKKINSETDYVSGSDNMFFESKDRRLFIFRPEYTEGQTQLNKRV